MPTTLDDILNLITPRLIIITRPARFGTGDEVLLLRTDAVSWALPTRNDCSGMDLSPEPRSGYAVARVGEDFKTAGNFIWVTCAFALDSPLDPDSLAALRNFAPEAINTFDPPPPGEPHVRH